jgi:hypothetical protein
VTYERAAETRTDSYKSGAVCDEWLIVQYTSSVVD